MPLPYKVILCEEDTETPLCIDSENGSALGEPKKGDAWPVWIDGKQVYCEVVDIGDPMLVSRSDGEQILCRELRVRRP